MNEEQIHCPRCEKDVRIAETPAPRHGGHANLPDQQVVCLDFGEGCTASSCPLCGVPGIVMGVRLARSGMRPEEGWETVRGRCEGCQRVVDLEVLDPEFAYCPECGTTNRWALLEGENGLIVVTGVVEQV